MKDILNFKRSSELNWSNFMSKMLLIGSISILLSAVAFKASKIINESKISTNKLESFVIK